MNQDYKFAWLIVICIFLVAISIVGSVLAYNIVDRTYPKVGNVSAK